MAERGKRIYAVRMVRDVEGSKAMIRAEIAEVEAIPEEKLEDIVSHYYIILKHAGSISNRDDFLRHLDKTQKDPNSVIGRRDHEKLTEIIRFIKKCELESLNEYLIELGD